MTKSTTRKLTRAALLGSASLALMISAAYAEKAVEFKIKSGSLVTALNEYARQSDQEILFSSDIVAGKEAKAVNGVYEPEEALDLILADTGLVYAVDEGDTVLIKDPAREAAAPRTFRVAQLDQEDAVLEIGGSDEDDGQQYETIIVTGTNIRGVSDQFSPVTSFDRDDFEAAGFATVTDLIQNLPQNFGGGVSPDTAADTGSGPGASSINLRGLGAEATLTLLNGRRLAPGGLSGVAVDISSIPVGALDRVEVLTDGASAVYGSDAVAGVVNFILREDYNGNESRIRLGTLTEGDGDNIQLGHTFGVSGDTGRLLISYEFFSEDELDGNSKDFTAIAPDPYEILPSTERHSVLLSSALSLRDNIEFYADGYYNERSSQQTTTGTVTRTGNVDVEQFGGSLGVNFDFSDGWQARVSGSYARSDFQNSARDLPSGGLLDSAETDIWSLDALLDGALFSIPGGPVRAVVGAQYREESHDGFRGFFDPNFELLPFTTEAADTDRSVAAAFAEFYVPLVSDSNSFSGVRSLSLSLSGRYEDYSDFGSTFNPKVGLAWAPLEDVTLRATYGTSFRAPGLQQLTNDVSFAFLVDYIDPDVPSGQSVALRVGGQNGSELGPEESTSWTLGFDYEPQFAPGAKLRTTYYEIDYTDRVATPFPLQDASFFNFDFPLPVDRIDGATAQDLVDQAGLFFNFTPFSGSNSDVADVTVLLDARPTNASASRVSGLDVDLSYDFDAWNSDWVFFFNGSYLFKSEDQFSELRPTVINVDTIFNPSDLRFRSGLNWSGRGIGASVFANYVDDYEDNQVLGDALKVDSWFTVDASLRYDLGEQFTDGLLSETVLTLSARNLFDTAPPEITQTTAPGNAARLTLYDSANADPQGRSIALQITKKW